MKKMKKLIVITLVMTILTSVFPVITNAKYLYKPYGEYMYVSNYEDITPYLYDGWYEYPVVMLYAEDGRCEVFPESMKDAQLTVGWYEHPEKMLYAEGGRAQSFPLSIWRAQLTVGWYENPYVMLYAADGRSQKFSLSIWKDQLTVGWYQYPVTTVYALDGRSAVIPKDQLQAWLNVGWYEEYTKVYDIYGWENYLHWSKMGNPAIYGYYRTIQPFDSSMQLDYSQKLNKVFPSGNYFATKEQAEAYMTTVTVPVWCLRANGTKYSTTKSIKVNSGLAQDVINIFTDIFYDPSQFPMNSIGGFSWRNTASGNVSQHSYGTCIDINPNENYYVRSDGTPITGSHWSPGVDPYSISGDSIVVRTFAKYGWAWGGNAWSEYSNKDYMHFTYLGG